MSDASKKPIKKVRIVQRADGEIFGWTPHLEANPQMHPGQLLIFADGSKQIQLDKSAKRDLDVSTVTQRETALIDENVQLRQQLANLLAGNRPLPLPVAPAPVSLEPGETAIPAMPLDEEDFDDIKMPPEEPVTFAPEPVMLSDDDLYALRKDRLLEHIKGLDHTVNPPSTTLKDDLVTIALDLQAKYQAKIQG